MGPSSRSAWYVVAVVGLVVAALPLLLSLFPRLNSAGNLVSGLEPAFTQERVEGARAGVTIVSQITDLATPIATDSGSAAAEVPQLVTFVSQRSGLPEPEVLAALEQNVPHTTDLLLSLPLSSVTAELPGLVTFLSQTLRLSEEETLAALQENFPGIYQVIDSLPKVTDGWDQVPGVESLTRFNGDQVTNVPDVRDYFADDVVPVLETQQENFESLSGLPGGPKLIPPLLLVLGLAVFVFAIVMSLRSPEGRASRVAWGLVTAVGVVIIVLVVGILGLFNRLGAGQKVLDAAAPAFTEERVAGHVPAITIVSQITDLGDPIMTESGTAAPEVPELVAFVSQRSGLPEPAVLAALTQNAPHTMDLLLSLPLSAVSAELPTLVPFLSQTMRLPDDQTQAAIQENFPGIAQVIEYLPQVTSGWDKVPGTEDLTRFNGEPVSNVPDVRDYLAEDVVAATVNQQQNFANAADPWPKLTVFAPLLLVVGVIVTIYGAVMFLAAGRRTKT